MRDNDSGAVLDFQEIDRSLVALVGGKGANLGELSRVDGVQVPDGYCVTTGAFRRVLAEAPSIGDALDGLARLDPGDREAIRALSAEVRGAIESAPVPDDLAEEITRPLARLGAEAAYAVRSSATAEDLPSASFAGQQDTYLNVVGRKEILGHVRRCWASLCTERAVTYRLRNGFDHHKVHMAVVVQRMVDSEVAGILFTADPVTSNRRITTVEASFGLGEALVSGLVNADVYQVRDGEIVDRTISAKNLAIRAVPEGGTREREIEPELRERQALTDAQVVRLAELGRRIEAHFGRPQDIEWCLTGDGFQIVQSRPITTLFPVPETGDEDNHVYLSVGHQQMMTDAMKPLGLSVWQLTTPRPMAEAGGRLFVDATKMLGAPTSRDKFLEMSETSDPLTADALRTVLDRGDFVPSLPDGDQSMKLPGEGREPIETDPAIAAELIANGEESIAAAKRGIQGKSGVELFDFIMADFEELRRILFDPRSHQAIMASMDTTWWLNENLRTWLGEENAADTLTLSAPGNVTSEMGLALLDVADAIRPHPEVVAFLRTVEGDDFLDELAGLDGGPEARAAIEGYLDKYGMRCVGEIDITRPRWSEQPAALVPVLLGNIDNFEQGASERRFEEGREEAEKKEQEVLARLRMLPDGERKADETQRMIDRLRTYVGYREYPKYGMISRYFVYKRALLEEAERLVRDGVLDDREDIFFLRLQELHEVARTGKADHDLIRERKAAFKTYETLTPPRVLTSDGEALVGSYRREDAPEGALLGLPVSTGTVEGRARVVLDMADADLEAGDILVTAYTDPSWSPLFVTAAGLVTEVGGQMTHGAVVAREYGLPAVVGVPDATRLVEDGQRIRVDGTTGYVEILS
ncbi:rifamycin-inactivating phosphotransferase [Amycolatopsis sp. CA-230715]|uniref:rifamycin-inactivating phosphotransferase n=1 Tax=Amycolatopsis sp. CA-230715 TaxID=2745196 RepID=UPI001C01F093|nr:rifamycin-inactivating phosphotransferase [Amycolatopsis sp. CA-230715]QWF80973.1 rifamycin-inactivating phosphotransferase Rph [Amycolatopsis sp. CA-230715]